MKYSLLAGLLCSGIAGLAQGPKKATTTAPLPSAGAVYSVASTNASASAAASVDTTYLSSADFSGTGTIADPIRIKTSAIQTWLQSLPGYTSDGGKYLASDFTWKTIATSTPVPQLATPSLTATAVSSSTISLSWTDVANETGYLLQRSGDNATWTTVANLGANATQFTNGGLTAATFYYYRIKALGDNVSYSDGGYGWDGKSTLAASGGGGNVLVSAQTLLFDVANANQVQQHSDGPGTYYSSQGNGIAQATKKVAAGSDGLVYFQYLAGTGELVSLGYKTTNLLQGYYQWMGGLIITEKEVKAYGWNGSTTGLGVAPEDGHYYGFRRAGSNIEIVTSADGNNWTVLDYTNYSGDDLYPQLYFQTPTSKAKMLGLNLVSY